MTRHELIARLEAATGPDVSLDIAIHSFINAGKRIWCQRGFRDTLGFAGTVWQAFGEKMNPLLKQSMTCLLSLFVLPRSRLEKHK
jgi:hypothetical protein